MNVCHGCGTEIPPSRGNRPRKWCSERCRKNTSYTAACIDCGTRTSWNGTSTPSLRCYPCSHDRRIERLVLQAEVTREEIIHQIRLWAERYGEPPAVPDWNGWQSRNAINDEMRARRYEEGDWPCHTTVYRHFESWGAALEAAGFEARAPHGGDGNQFRRRSMRAAA